MSTNTHPAIRLLEQGIAFVQRSGLKVLELKPGYVKVLMPLSGNVNHIGTMYAGALFTLAEIPGGALFLSSFDATKYYPIVKDMQIAFRRPARSDVVAEYSMSAERVVEIQASADENGKVEFTLEGELKDADGTVVATAKGLYQLRRIGN